MIVPECKSARQSSIQGSQYSCFNLSSAVNARVRSRCFQCKCLHNFCFFHFLALPSNFEFVLANLLKINASQDKPVCQSGGETAFKPCTSAVIVSWKIMIRWCRVKRMDKGKERDGKKTARMYVILQFMLILILFLLSSVPWRLFVPQKDFDLVFEKICQMLLSLLLLSFHNSAFIKISLLEAWSLLIPIVVQKWHWHLSLFL